jgi:hypothetical protein
MDAAELIDRD